MIQIDEERTLPYYQMPQPEKKYCPDDCLAKISCVIKAIFCCSCPHEIEETDALNPLLLNQNLKQFLRETLPQEISDLKIDEISSIVFIFIEEHNIPITELTIFYHNTLLQIQHTTTQTTLISRMIYFPKEAALYDFLRKRFTTSIPNKKIIEITLQLLKQIQPRHLKIQDLILRTDQNYLLVNHPDYPRPLLVNQLYVRPSPVMKYSCLPTEITLSPLTEETESSDEKSD